MTSKILRDVFTEVDGSSHDIVRYSWVVCLLAGFGLAVWKMCAKGDVTLGELGIFIVSVVGAHGSVIWAKDKTATNAGEAKP